ncbi:MAG: aryl-sulfate sulfotransferase [Gemmatimonadota bacterium]
MRQYFLPLVLTATVVLVACGDATAPEPVPGVVSAYALESPHPLVRRLTVQLSSPGAVEVAWETDGEPGLRIELEEIRTSHELDLARLLPGRSYRIQARGLDGQRRGEPWDTVVAIPELPADVAALTFSAEGTPTAPLTLLEVVGSSSGWTGALLLDGQGRVLWYHESTGSLFGTAVRPGGNILMLDHTLGIAEVGLDGRTVHALPQHAEPYGEIHHDLTLTPSGTVLFLARDPRPVDGQEVVGEAVWEWDAATGTLEKHWSAHDHFRWPDEVGERSSPSNWLHANSIEVGARGNVIVSGRNTDQIWSVAPDYASVEWRLGGAGATLPLAPADRFYGQHGAREVAADRFILFDNGFGRPAGQFSRAMEFQVDRGAGTVQKIWEYRPSPDIYAALVGSVRRLSNGNTVINFGMHADHVGSTGPLRVVEVAPDGTEVWRLTPGPALTRIYRATPLLSWFGEEPGG